jgi:hypothetical protein
MNSPNLCGSVASSDKNSLNSAISVPPSFSSNAVLLIANTDESRMNYEREALRTLPTNDIFISEES